MIFYFFFHLLNLIFSHSHSLGAFLIQIAARVCTQSQHFLFRSLCAKRKFHNAIAAMCAPCFYAKYSFLRSSRRQRYDTGGDWREYKIYLQLPTTLNAPSYPKCHFKCVTCFIQDYYLRKNYLTENYRVPGAKRMKSLSVNVPKGFY